MFVVFGALALLRCREFNPASAPHSLTRQDVLGVWYAACLIDSGGPPAVFAVEFRDSDSVVQHFVNCTDNVPFVRGTYALDGNTLRVTVRADTTGQSALEYLFSSSKQGNHTALVSLHSGRLVIQELTDGAFFESERYDSVLPALDGATVSGTLTLPSMPPGAYIRVHVMEFDTADQYPLDCYVTFTDKAGQYCVKGVGSGIYAVFARCFTKELMLALVSASADTAAMDSLLAAMPQGYYPFAITVPDSGTVTGIDISIPAQTQKRPSSHGAACAAEVRATRTWLTHRLGR